MVENLSAISRELCEEVKPCEAEQPAKYGLSAKDGQCDPHDLCTSCDGVDAAFMHVDSSDVLASCIASVNWACCGSDPDARQCYAFCDSVPEEGLNASDVTFTQLSTITSWQKFRRARM